MEYDELHHRKEGGNASIIKNIAKKVVITALIACTVFNIPFMTKKCNADVTTEVNVKINYLDEVAYISNNVGVNTKFYMSTDKMKTWELLDAGYADISNILTVKDTLIYFKGNKDTKPKEVPLQGEDKTLTAAYNVTGGVGSITYTSTSGLAVEYRKGLNGAWRTATNGMLTSLYEIKGATLFFRTAATADKRAGKVITVRIPKRPSAPSVKVDGSKFRITGLKSGVTQYRINDNTTWNTFTASSSTQNYIDLAVLGGATNSNLPIPAGVIELRTAGADKKLNSSVRVVEIPQQRVITVASASVTGSALTILDTSKTAYEYTIVTNGKSLDLTTAKWTSVASNKTTIVPKVSLYDKILVRMKSYSDSSTKQVIPASTYLEFTVTGITPNTK